jgi:predicted transcriptional regulator
MSNAPQPPARASRQRHAIAAERRARALELTAAGWTTRQIGEALEVSHVQAARYVRQALEARHRETMELAEHYREAAAETVRGTIRELWPYRADPMAASTIIRGVERLAKLYGLDAAAKVELAGTVYAGQPDLSHLTADELEQVSRLLEAADERGRLAAGG